MATVCDLGLRQCKMPKPKNAIIVIEKHLMLLFSH